MNQISYMYNIIMMWSDGSLYSLSRMV